MRKVGDTSPVRSYGPGGNWREAAKQVVSRERAAALAEQGLRYCLRLKAVGRGSGCAGTVYHGHYSTKASSCCHVSWAVQFLELVLQDI